MFSTGGGDLYLIPPPREWKTPAWQARTLAQKKADLSLLLWKDESRTQLNPWIAPWCILEDSGLKVTMKQGVVTFKPNNGPPKNMRTGAYEEATATGSALDVVCSPAHYVDLMGTKDVVNFYQRPATAAPKDANTEMISIGPSKVAKRMIIVFRDLGHPQFEGRYTVRYFCGELSVDFEGEFSISNPLKAEIRIDLFPLPGIKQPNGMDVYQVLEMPVDAPSVPDGPGASSYVPADGGDGDDGDDG
jgi:hypothetical protein